jgi:hypothetical protein
LYTVNHAHIAFYVIDDRILKPCRDRASGTRLDPAFMPCSPDNNWYYTFNPLAAGYPQEINGRTAHVTASADGYGLQDIEWRDGTYHYVLVANRLNRPTGHSGVPFAELVKMAKSVATNPSEPAVPPLPNPPDVSIPASALPGFHRMGRQLLAANGASIMYDGGRHGTLEIDIEPPGAHIAGFSPIDDSDSDPAKWQRQGATLVHVRVDGKSATGWIGGHEGVSGLRCTIDGYTVGFVGAFGSVSDYQHLASALTIIAHQPGTS